MACLGFDWLERKYSHPFRAQHPNEFNLFLNILVWCELRAQVMNHFHGIKEPACADCPLNY